MYFEKYIFFKIVVGNFKIYIFQKANCTEVLKSYKHKTHICIWLICFLKSNIYLKQTVKIYVCVCVYRDVIPLTFCCLSKGWYISRSKHGVNILVWKLMFVTYFQKHDSCPDISESMCTMQNWMQLFKTNLSKSFTFQIYRFATFEICVV